MSYNDIIQLNVGGKSFTTTRQTLMREPNSVLGRMFDIDSPLAPAAIDKDGAYFMDRDPKKFETILNYLREKNLPELNKAELKNLLVEASYFQLTELEAEITARLDNMEVYKFKYEFDEEGNPGTSQYVTVKKSSFGDVPYYAIVNFFEKGICSKKDLFKDESDFLALDENEIITVNHFYHKSHNLKKTVQAAKNYLGCLSKMMKTQQVTYNIDGNIFCFSIETACKDPESYFSKFWNDGDLSDLLGFFFYYRIGNLDKPGSLKRKYLCFELNEDSLSANPNARCNGCGPNSLKLHTTETRFLNALSKLKTANNVDELHQISTEHEKDILRLMGLIRID